MSSSHLVVGQSLGRRELGSVAAACLLALATGVSVPFLMKVGSRVVSPWTTMFVLAGLIVVLIGIKPRFSVLDSKNWILAYLSLSILVRSFTLLTNDDGAIPIFRVSPQATSLGQDIAVAHLQTALGLVAFGVTFWFVRRRLLARGEHKLITPFRVSYPAALVLMLLSLATLPAQVALSRATTSPTAGGDFTLALPSYVAAGAGCIVAFSLWRNFKVAFPILIVAAADSGLRVLLLGSKSSAFALMTGLFLGYVATVGSQAKSASLRRILKSAPIPVLVVVALLIFSRPLPSAGDDIWSRVYVGAGAAISRSYGTDGLISANAYLRDGHPLLMGNSFAEIVYSWVPRQLWPNKPRSFSDKLGTGVFAYRADAGSVFVAPGFSGEWLLNFGLIGLVLGWSLFGALAGSVDTRVSLPYRVLWIFALAHLVEGPVVSQFWLSAPFIAGGTLVLWLSRRNAPTPALASNAADSRPFRATEVTSGQ